MKDAEFARRLDALVNHHQALQNGPLRQLESLFATNPPSLIDKRDQMFATDSNDLVEQYIDVFQSLIDFAESLQASAELTEQQALRAGGFYQQCQTELREQVGVFQQRFKTHGLISTAATDFLANTMATSDVEMA